MKSPELPARQVQAVHDPRLSARVVRRVPLHYAEGADEVLDRSAHVRAASGIVWIGDRLAVVQDDANFIALVDVKSGVAEFRTLPADASGKRLFDEERGNKADKHDFESVMSAALLNGTPALFTFGSGSTTAREYVGIIPLDAATAVRLVHAPSLYSSLRACDTFAGSQLNIEGAVRIDDCVRLFGRGNGAIADGVVRVDATCDLNWEQFLRYLDSPDTCEPPQPFNVVQFQLGDLDGTRITFTDAAAIPEGLDYPHGSMLYTGAAEASKDVVLDGPVAGSVIGVIPPGMGSSARFAVIHDESGAPVRAKVEGIAIGDFLFGQVFVVVDVDDHRRPSELWELVFMDRSDDAARGVSSQTGHLPTTDLPAHEPDQLCESCGTVGTTGRITKFEPDGRVREMHRFCSQCWPEQRARYNARWTEEDRVARDAWERAAFRSDDWSEPAPQSGSTEETCATWHLYLQMWEDFKQMRRYMTGGSDTHGNDLPMAEFAQILKAAVPETLGEIPWEFEQIILAHGDTPRESTVSLPPNLVREAAMAEARRDMDALLARMDESLKDEKLPPRAEA